MSNLQNTNFDSYPEISEQKVDNLQQNIQPSTTPSPTAGYDTHCTDDEYRDLFEPDTAMASIEQPPTTSIENEITEAFASDSEVFAHSKETSARLLVPTHLRGLKHESLDPALFSTEDMDAIFGKTNNFNDNFKFDDSYKLEDSSPTPWTSDGKNTGAPALASPFVSNIKVDYSYLTSDTQSRPQLERSQERVQLHPQRYVDSQHRFTELTHPAIAENPQLACYRFPDGRRRSHSVPPDVMKMGMRPPANMGHSQPDPYALRQQHTPQPQFRRVMSGHRHHSMTPAPPQLRHYASAMNPITIAHGFERGQPVFHRQVGVRARAVSPQPKRKRQKVGHFVEVPKEPVSHLFETMMGNVEFIIRQGLAGMRYRMDDEFERSLAESRLQNSRITNLSQPLAPMACREPPSFSVPNSGVEIKQADTQTIQALLTFYEIPFASTMFLPDKKLLYLRYIGASGTLCHLVLD